MSEQRGMLSVIDDSAASAASLWRTRGRRLPIDGAMMATAGVAVLLGSLAWAGPAMTYQMSQLFVGVLFAVAVSFVIGMSGTPAFGNQLFYAGGAYLVAVLSTRLGVEDLVVLCVASLAFGAVLGGLTSLLLRKITGVAFGMVSLAIGQMAFVFVERSDLLNGENGISGIPSGSLLGLQLSASQLLTFIWVVVAFGVVAVALVARSRWGLLTRASRDSTARAAAVGIPTFRYHAVAFTLGAALSGLAGGLIATTVGTVDQSMFYWTAGAVPILAGLMGGIRTVKGPILGAVILSIVVIWVSAITTIWLLIEGVLTLGIFLIWPEGLLGEGRDSGVGTLRRLVSRIRRAPDST